MVNATAREGEARLQVVRLQVGHLVKNLGGVETRNKKVEDIADANPHPPHTGTTSALLRVDGDTVK